MDQRILRLKSVMALVGLSRLRSTTPSPAMNSRDKSLWRTLRRMARIRNSRLASCRVAYREGRHEIDACHLNTTTVPCATQREQPAGPLPEFRSHLPLRIPAQV